MHTQPALTVSDLVRRASLDGLHDQIQAAHEAGDVARRDRLCVRWNTAVEMGIGYKMQAIASLSHA